MRSWFTRQPALRGLTRATRPAEPERARRGGVAEPVLGGAWRVGGVPRGADGRDRGVEVGLRPAEHVA